MKKLKELLTIPIEGDRQLLYTHDQKLISNGYSRVVIGQRGPYVEFTKNQIIDTELYIPKSQLYRLSDPKVYYIEFRTINNNIKVYYQMRTVAYADYQINYFYISPYDLYNESGECCILTPDVYSTNSSEFFEFDLLK